MQSDTREGPVEPQSSGRDYWRFYWPLLMMSLAMVVARQLQNATLARYPQAVREIVVFAYASSVYWIFNAVLAFVPQMTNVLGRSGRSRAVCLRFTVAVCLALTAPLLVLSFTPAGPLVLAALFDIEGPVLADVVRYLRLLSPLILLNGLRHFYTGLLVQAKRTGVVAMLNVAYVLLMLGVLLVGFHLGWNPAVTLVSAQAVPLAVQMVWSWHLCRMMNVRTLNSEGDEVSYRKALAFFWPVALTGVMFSITRPIIYSFAGRLEDPQPMVAALRVGFDLSMLFQMTSNQFRHVFVTFGHRNLAGLRRFMRRVVLVVTGLMLVTAVTPLKTLFIGHVLGWKPPVLEMAGHVFLVLCPVPLVIAWRNYYHGLAMVHRRTAGMFVGGISRNATAYLCCWGLLAMGHLTSASAAAVLVCGFFAEALAVIVYTRGWRRERIAGD